MRGMVVLFVLRFKIFPFEINNDQRKPHCKLRKKVVKGNSEGELHSVIKKHFFHYSGIWFYEVPQIYPLKPEIPAFKKSLYAGIC